MRCWEETEDFFCHHHFFILLVHKKMHVLPLEQSTTIQYALGAESAATYKEKHWRLNSAQELMNKVGHLPVAAGGMHFREEFILS